MSWEQELEDVPTASNSWESELEDVEQTPQATTAPRPQATMQALDPSFEPIPEMGTFEALQQLPSRIVENIPIVGAIGEKVAGGADWLTSQFVGDDPKEKADLQKDAEMQRAIERYRFKRDNPRLDIGANLGGSMLIPPAKGVPVGAINKAYNALAGGRVFGPGKNALTGAVKATGNVAAVGTGQAGLSYADSKLRDEEQSEQRALTTGGLAGGIEALGQTGKLLKVGRNMIGASDELVDAYKAVPKEIRQRTKEGDGLSKEIRGLYEDIKKPIDRSKQDLADVDSFVSLNKADEKRQADLVRSLVSDAKEQMRSTQLQPKTLDQLTEARQELRRQISDGSTRAFEELSRRGDVQIDIRPFMAGVKQDMNRANIGDVSLRGNDPLAGVYQDLEKINQSIGTKLSPEDTKKVIQYLDEISESVYKGQQTGTYTSKALREVKDLRRRFDQNLKSQIPEYEDLMRPVAAKTQLAGQIDDILGKNPRNLESSAQRFATQKSNRFDTDNQQMEMLEGQTGTDFMRDLKRYREAQLGASDSTAIANRLPESGDLQRTRQAVGDLENIQSQARLDNQDMKNLKPESLLNNILKRSEPGLENLDKLKNLGEREGQDFVKRAEQLAAVRAMDKANPQGSKLVNMAGAIGRFIGTPFGDMGQNAGAAAGNLVGSATDNRGRKVFAQFLDFKMDVLDSNPAYVGLSRALDSALRKSPYTAAAMLYSAAKEDPRLTQEIIDYDSQRNN